MFSGESASVNVQIVNNWKDDLSTIIQGYKETDIYNCDESGLAYKSTTNKSIVLKGDNCHGGKKHKDRFTILLTVSWAGEKMKPILIGKSKTPRGLKNVDMKKLPVKYCSQSNAWMAGPLFEEYLIWFDKEVGKTEPNRKVLLFIDNASVHKSALAEVSNKLKHTMVILFPKNTTSHTQPLDAGIIQAVKLGYRSSLNNHVMRKLDDDI